MRNIHKYNLAEYSVLDLPIGSKLIHVGEQNNLIFGWFEVAENETNKTFLFDFVYTGDAPIDDFEHFKTIQMENGLVIHVYFNEKYDI